MATGYIPISQTEFSANAHRKEACWSNINF